MRREPVDGAIHLPPCSPRREVREAAMLHGQGRSACASATPSAGASPPCPMAAARSPSTTAPSASPAPTRGG